MARPAARAAAALQEPLLCETAAQLRISAKRPDRRKGRQCTRYFKERMMKTVADQFAETLAAAGPPSSSEALANPTPLLLA
jgi:hypothetical protein